MKEFDKIPEINENADLQNPAWFSFYQDRKERVIWLLTEIDSGNYDNVAMIIDWNKEDKDIPIENRKPIKVIVASPGGSLDVTRTLSEIIRLSKTPVIGIAIGTVASGASMVYMSCHRKYAFNNVTFLLHKGSCDNLGGNYNELQQFMDNYKKDIEEMTNFYISHTKIEPEIIRNKLKEGDWYISITDAIEYGIVDEILESIDILL